MISRPLRAAWLAIALAACGGDGKDVVPPGTDTPADDADGDGFSIADGDCDDEADAVFPGANDVVGDGIDQNCDLLDGVDVDRDGHAWTGSGGDDCDDADAEVFAGAPEIGWDGVDQDCDLRDRFDFELVAAGGDHTCAIDSQGLVQCFGVDDEGQVTARPQDGGWNRICSAQKFSCAVNADGRLDCWGTNEFRQQTDLPAGSFTDVACNRDAVCALDANRELHCWGGEDGNLIVANAPTGVQFQGVSVGGEFACAITQDRGLVACWGEQGAPGEDPVGDAPAAQQDFLSVVTGALHACAIRQDLGLVCWGGNNLGQTSSPNDAGPYSMLATANNSTCSISEGRTLQCWGSDATFVVSQAPRSDDIAVVSVGTEHACGLRTASKEMVCWGKNTDGRATVPWPAR